MNITVKHKCEHISIVKGGKDEHENAVIESKAKDTYCPSCQEAIDEHNRKTAQDKRYIVLM